MAELLQNYPKSSCNCYNCESKFYNFHDNGIPTNMSVRDCDFSKYYDCDNKRLFKTQIEPRNLNKYEFLNPNTISKSYDKSFTGLKGSATRSYNNTVYTTNDPRLMSPNFGGEIMALDKPPINESIELDKIYTDPTMKYYGQQYNSYKDINAGQILYYIDKSIEDSLFDPLFVNNANVEGVVYKDPMGSMKPQYLRTPIKNQNLLETRHNNNHGELTWVRDSQETREDLMATQMSTINRQKYSSRWTGNLLN
jgi:hypothetical protein